MTLNKRSLGGNPTLSHSLSLTPHFIHSCTLLLYLKSLQHQAWLSNKMLLPRNRKPLGLDHQERKNPLTKQEGTSFSISTKVGGSIIHFHRDAINEFLEAQIIILSILHNIRPRSHTSTFTKDVAQLLYLIMKWRRIDVAQIISTKMRNVAESGREFGSGTKTTCPLVYHSLIMGLIIDARVHIQNFVHLEIKTKVNDAYVERREARCIPPNDVSGDFSESYFLAWGHAILPGGGNWSRR
ncbi:unnamed protein product [Vicia faba]|uniref:Putative plant transposon protein domain-containing protein n=1 Tax=Vicia faba TaxID=3906 RepID=A0AAV1B0F9_VICFA|nr:unnamed protein product [Vicia faba]